MRDTTDLTLFVRTSGEEVVEWNRQRIIDALVREASIPEGLAAEISREVERQIVASGITTLTASLVRELVNAKLVERGMEKARRMHARLGFPLYDIAELIKHQNRENANVPHWPEGTNLALAEGIKREYALFHIFSSDIAEAHVAGDLHIHDLGFIDRPYSMFQSLEYVKKFGLDLPDWFSVAAPAKHAEVLLAHMVRFSAALQGNFGGSVRWDAVNILFAPYLTTLGYREIKQLAQMLVFEFSQLATARGGQLMSTTMDLYWEVPDHLKAAKAIGPGGETTGKKYEDYMPGARRFAQAILEAFREGDARGRPFFFPIPVIHLNENAFLPENRDFLLLCCETAAAMGNPHFVFDRKDSAVLPLAGTDTKPAEPWKMRCAAIQNVSLNLARPGYLARKNDAELFSLIGKGIETAVRAHSEKRIFLEGLLREPHGPLSFLNVERDGAPYLDMGKAVYLIGMVGLAELARIHMGIGFERNGQALEFCREVISFIKKTSGRLAKKYGLKVLLGQTPAESASYKFARLDLKRFSPESARFIKGDFFLGGLYYSESALLPAEIGIGPRERTFLEGALHEQLEGACTRIPSTGWDAEKICQLLGYALHETGSRQLTFAPVFTACLDCRKTSPGHFAACPGCGGRKIETISKITGYFARSSSLNPGKLAELADTEKAIS
jgi:ribonucleoside-triphosphate reductase